MGLQRRVERNIARARQAERRARARRATASVTRARFKIARGFILAELRESVAVFRRFPNKETWREGLRLVRFMDELADIEARLFRHGELLIDAKHRIFQYLLGDEAGKILRLVPGVRS
jgi:hypothetical protein